MTQDDILLSAGDLRHRITLQAQSSAQNATGEPVQTWTNQLTLWAAINVMSMRQAFGSDELVSQATDVWSIRYPSTTVTPGMRIAYGSRTFLIQAINNVGGRNVVVHILALEINPSST